MHAHTRPHKYRRFTNQIIEVYIPFRAKERAKGLGPQMGQGNSWGGEKRKYLVNKSCHALQVRFCVENLISDHSSVPGTGPLPNVNFPYERIF